jgi:hypothetical protein
MRRQPDFTIQLILTLQMVNVVGYRASGIRYPEFPIFAVYN